MPLRNPSIFYDRLRAGLLGPTLSDTEVDGVRKILAACEGFPLSHTAYCLATAYHETAHSMQPVEERGGDAYFFRMYDKDGARPALAIKQLGNTQPGDGVRFRGRGYPQLTGRANYARADRELGMNGSLLAVPSQALKADVAAKIMRLGMSEGWFTGKKLSDYLPMNLPAEHKAFVNARRIINGTDKAELIAGYADEFQRALIQANA